MTRPVFFAIALLAFAATLAAGCHQFWFPFVGDSNGEAEVSPGGAVTDYVSLMDGLRAAGATVESTGEVLDSIFSVDGQIVTMNGADVQVYEYANHSAAAAEAAGISPDGTSITTAHGAAMVTWVATPHFYQAGRLIVLYVGDDAAITALLESVLGTHIAGG